MSGTYRESGQISEDEDESVMPYAAQRSDASKRAYLPEIWNEDVRMNALFSDFRNRDLNPAAYDSKLKFWTGLIEKCVLEDDLVVFSISDLREKFQRKGRKPQGLATVLDVLQSTKRFMKKDDFFSASQESWVSWGFDNLVKKPLWWSATYALGLQNQQNADQVRFVYMDLVKSKAAEVLDRAQSGILPSSAIDLATFKELFGDIVSESALPVVLKYLQRADQVVVTDLENDDHATIKFLRQGPNSISSKSTSTKISDADRGVVTLRKSLQKMEKEVSVIHNRINEADGEVRIMLKAGKKPLALKALKRKKLLEKGLAQKDAVVANIENMLFRLENSENDEKVFEAYKAGLSALKKVQKDTKLEDIEGIVDEMQESMNAQEEIAQAISSPTKTLQENLDEEELEQELKDLLDDDVTDDLINQLDHLHVAGDKPRKESPSVVRSPKIGTTARPSQQSPI